MMKKGQFSHLWQFAAIVLGFNELGPRTLSPGHLKSLGPKAWGPMALEPKFVLMDAAEEESP